MAGKPQKPGRTASGKPNAAAYAKHGTPNGSGGKSFPVWDHQSGEDALQARGRAKSMTSRQVVDKVARYANKADDTSLKKQVAQAKKTERQKKK